MHKLTKETVENKVSELREIMHSQRGKNAMIFLAFLCISAVLWVVQSLNEEVQRDFRCPIRITNVPDSLVRVSPLPEAISVTVVGKGTQFLKYWGRKPPQFTIDYRAYKSANKIQFGEAALKALSRNVFGAYCQVQSVTPDSLSLAYTSHPGVRVPIVVDAKIEAAAQYVLVGRPSVAVDSATLYSLDGVSSRVRSISTMPVQLSDLRKSQVLKVALAAPKGIRAIPDSVDLNIEIEPLISKTRKVAVTAINVPDSMKLIAVPAQIEVYYMVPTSIYKKIDSNPRFVVEADYRTIAHHNTDKIAVKLASAPKDFTNVFLSTDSVDYILERK